VTKKESTAVATRESTVVSSPLAGLPPEVQEAVLGAPGLGQMDGTDYIMPVLVFNVSTFDGAEYDPAKFLHSVSCKQADAVHMVVLDVWKHRQFFPFDNNAAVTVRVCESRDLATGRLFSAETPPNYLRKRGPEPERDCETCGAQDWYTDNDGQKKCDCKLVYLVAGYCCDTREIVFVKAKSSSFGPVKRWLNKHCLGKGPEGVNLPAYLFKTTLTLDPQVHGSTHYVALHLESPDNLGMKPDGIWPSVRDALGMYKEFSRISQQVKLHEQGETVPAVAGSGINSEVRGEDNEGEDDIPF
jgi:hypothetical protein